MFVLEINIFTSKLNYACISLIFTINTFNIMKTRAIVINFLFCLFLGVSLMSGATTNLSDNHPSDSVLWKQQLDTMKKNSAEYDLGYVLTGYKYIGKISTEKDLERIKLAILDGTGYPFAENGEKTLISLKEFSSIDKEAAENMREKVKAYLDQMLRLSLGLEEVELEWTCNGKIYKTVCAVSDKSGIIYDNVFINTLWPGETKTVVRSYDAN